MILCNKTPFLLADGEAIPMLHNTNIHEEKSGLVNENMTPVGPFQNGMSNFIIDLQYRKLKCQKYIFVYL